MIIRYRFLLLIHMLCCAATVYGILLDTNDAETCNLLCIQCNATVVFANGRCECNFANDSDKDAECIQRIQKENQAIEQNMLSENLVDEERNVRSLKYRRRLRPGDAEKVAQYFINGGPAAGHSHFVRLFSAARDSDSATNSFSGVVNKSNPEDGFHDVPFTSPISSNTYDSPLYMVSEYAPYGSPSMPGIETYPPTLRAMNPAIPYPPNGVYDSTVPLTSIGHLHGLPHALFRAVTFPAHVLHHILHPRVYHHPAYNHRGIIRSSNDGSDTQTVGQPCENNDDSITSSVPTARSNADKSADLDILGLTDSSLYPATYVAQPLYQPMQYQNLPYQYGRYYSPLMNILPPILNGYVLQPISPYSQDKLSDPLTSASDPQFSCNANTEQKNKVPTADKTTYFNGADKSDDPNKNTLNNIPNEEKKTEKNVIDKSHAG